MSNNLRGTLSLLPVLLLVCGATVAQEGRESRILVINGQPGTAQVVEINGRSYVDLEALAQMTNGSLQFKANRILLTLPTSAGKAPETVPPPSPVDESALSRDFMKASIEAIASMREWASTLAYAIQNGYQVTEGWVATYREQASHNVKLASVAAATEADRNASQLLNNEFNAVQEWSNKLVEAKKTMDIGKYALSPNALREDSMSQKIITCGRFLGQMLGSSNFQDDPSCH